MRPRKNVLVCGNDPVEVSMIACMLRIQGFAPKTSTTNRLGESLKERFFHCVVLVERKNDDFTGLSAIIAEKQRIAVLRAPAGTRHFEVLENVRVLTVIPKGPVPSFPKPARQITAEFLPDAGRAVSVRGNAIVVSQ